MSTLAPTGTYSGDKNTKTGEEQHDVNYRLVSTTKIDTASAWNQAWNIMNARYPEFSGARLRSVKVTGDLTRYGTVFDVVGHYVLEPKEVNPRFATLHFSTRGGREKKVHSYGTVAYPGDGTPPNFNHGIGFNNGVFQGVDVVVPQFGFSIEYDFLFPELNDAQIAFMHNITGSVNVQPMWIFPKGCVLFLGMTGQSHREKNELTGLWDLWYRASFEFEAKPPIINGTIPPFSGVYKEGLQYFWVFHADQKDSTSQITIPRPVAGYVETVYPYADFSWFNTLQW